MPWRLRIVTDLGEAIRQRRLDLEGLLGAGLESARGERLIGVMLASENALARSIHNREPLPAKVGGTTSDVLVMYELLFGAEALSRTDSYSDEVLREQLGVDLTELEIALNARTWAIKREAAADRATAVRRRSAF